MKRIISILVAVLIFLCAGSGCSLMEPLNFGTAAEKGDVMLLYADGLSAKGSYYLYEYTTAEGAEEDESVPQTGYFYANWKWNTGDVISCEYPAMDGKIVSGIVREYPVTVTFSNDRAEITYYAISYATGAFDIYVDYMNSTIFMLTDPFASLEDVPELDVYHVNVPQNSVSKVYYYPN